MKRVLITGASGFIGSFLLQHLKGFDVQPLSLRDSSWTHQPLNADVIIHAAGIAHASKHIADEDYQEVNCQLTKRLLEKATESKVSQFIFLSTALVFGEGHVGAITTTSKRNPQNAYAKSKMCAEDVIHDHPSMPSLIFRLPLVVGKNPKGNVRSLQRLARVSPVFLRIPNQRSILTLDDLVRIMEEAITIQSTGVRHPFSQTLSTSELYQQLRGSFTLLLPLPKTLFYKLRTSSRFLSKLLGDFYYTTN